MNIEIKKSKKKNIQDGFLILYDKKHNQNITVQELCLECHIARTTFYSYYDNIDDVLKDIEDKYISEIIKVTKNIVDATCDKEINFIFVDDMVKYVEENKKIIDLFLNKRYNYRFVKKWKDAIKKHLSMRFKNKKIKNIELIQEMISAELISAVSYWLLNFDKIDKKALRDIVYKQLKMFE